MKVVLMNKFDVLEVGDAFIIQNGNQIRFVGYDKVQESYMILNKNLECISRHKSIDSIVIDHNINRVIKADKLNLVEVE